MSVTKILDPRTKLVFVLLFTILIFLIDKIYIIVILLSGIILIRFITEIKIRCYNSNNINSYIKNLLFLVLFILVTQAFFGPGDKYIIFTYSGFNITIRPDGFFFGLVIVFRLLSLIILFPVFTKTTSVYHIATALCGLGLNYRFAFIITTAFNLIPLFKEEALIIMDAQKLRGMRSFEKGSLIVRVKSYAAFAVSLVLGAMRKARNSSVAMDSRAFGIYKKRTWLDKPQIKTFDILIIISCIVFCIILLYLNYHIG